MVRLDASDSDVPQSAQRKRSSSSPSISMVVFYAARDGMAVAALADATARPLFFAHLASRIAPRRPTSASNHTMQLTVPEIDYMYGRSTCRISKMYQNSMYITHL